MLSFNQFYYLEESRFRDRKNQIHLVDVPMFSVFIEKDLAQADSDKLKSYKNILKRVCAQARNEIHKLGFSSMHANILIRDLSSDVNINTGGGVAAYAHRKGKYMSLSNRMINFKNEGHLVNMIVHEWAHLWMFNNSKSFKSAVREYYDLLKNYYIEIDPRKPSRKEKERIDSAWLSVFPKAIAHLVSDNNATLSKYLMQKNKTSAMNFENKISPVRDLKPEIYSSIRSAYTVIARKLGIPEKNDEFVSTASEIVWKKFSSWLKNPKPMKDPYDKLWVYNPHKPDNFSITKTLTSEFIKHSKDERESVDYSGEQYNNIRQIASALVRWVDEYGMSNDQELWATAIEYYKKLPKEHQRKIMELMYK